jgi:hypothetical protein
MTIFIRRRVSPRGCALTLVLLLWAHRGSSSVGLVRFSPCLPFSCCDGVEVSPADRHTHTTDSFGIKKLSGVLPRVFPFPANSQRLQSANVYFYQP